MNQKTQLIVRNKTDQQIQSNPNKNPSSSFYSNWQADSKIDMEKQRT